MDEFLFQFVEGLAQAADTLYPMPRRPEMSCPFRFVTPDPPACALPVAETGHEVCIHVELRDLLRQRIQGGRCGSRLRRAHQQAGGKEQREGEMRRIHGGLDELASAEDALKRVRMSRLVRSTSGPYDEKYLA